MNESLEGHLIDSSSGVPGLSGSLVEAWSAGVVVPAMAARATTDADGRFEMALDGSHFGELFADGERPALFFRVFEGERLVADTWESLTWRPNGRHAHVRIVVDRRNPPEDTADPAPSVVHGLVADAGEGPLAEVTVQVADRVLQRGALTDVQVATGTTDARGRYRIEYQPTAGKVTADLTVRAVDRSGVELVQSEVWCHAPPTVTIDLTVGGERWPGPSEHDEVTSRLADLDVAALDDEAAAFVACSRGVPAEQLDTLRTAARLARDSRLSPELLYALGSQGTPVDLRSLLAAPPGEPWATVERAIERNAVSPRLRRTLDADVEALRGAVVTRALEPADDHRVSVGDVLASGRTDRAVHAAFLDRFVHHEGTVEEFWADLVRRAPFDDPTVVEDLQLSLQLSLVTQGNMPLIRQLGARRADGRLRALPDLTALGLDDWRQLLAAAGGGGTAPIPPDVPGDTEEARTERYLDSIVAPLKAAFPGRYLRQSIIRGPDVDVALVRQLHHANDRLDPRAPLPDELRWGTIAERDRQRARASWERLRAEALAFPDFRADEVLAPSGPSTLVNPLRAGVDRLLTNLGDPELRAVNLDTAIAERGDAAFAGIAETQRPAVVRQAKIYQRIHRVAPRSEHVEVLLGAGFHSALGIALVSPTHFARQLGTDLGGHEAAHAVHKRAKQYAGSVQTALTSTKQAYLEAVPWAIGGGTSPSGNGADSKTTASIDGMPDLESLFGEQAFCECSQCRSVYSPAAYLVDLLQFLGPKARSHLLQRRPDLAHLLLSCENTNTTIPYIDLVNEILEWRVAEPANDLPAHDTEGATAAELRATPQHVVDAAYDTVADAVSPMTLPFHRSLATTRLYLSHLGVSREALLELFRPGNDAWDAARVAEALGMSTREYQIVTDTVPNPLPLHEYYGDLDPGTWRDEIAKAPVFLRQTGLVFTDLVELVTSWFVNRHQSVPAQRIALDAPGECDVEGMTITHLDDENDAALGRIHRFLRLWRRLSWTMADLDRALFAFGATDLDAGVLRQLAQLRRLTVDLRLSVAEVLALWAPIDTWGHDAQYLALFRSRAVARLEDSESFALAYPFADPGIKDPAAPFELADTSNLLGNDPHTAVVLAALRITEPDLDVIRGHAGIEPDAPIDLTLLSTLYRYAVLARGLRLRMADLVSLLHLTGLDPFQPQDPTGTLDFARAVARVKRSGMRIEILDYLYRHALRPTRGPAPTGDEVDAVLVAVRDGLRALHDDLVDRDDPTGDDLRAKLGTTFSPKVVDAAMAVILGDAASLPADPAAFLDENFAAFAAPDEAAAALLHPLPLSEQQRLDNISWVRDRLLPWLRVTLARAVVVTNLADAVGLPLPLTRALVELHLGARAVPGGRLVDDFLALATTEPVAAHQGSYEVLHKAALLISGLGLTEQEVDHLLAQPERFAGFTLDGLPLATADDQIAAQLFAAWSRLADLVDLRAGLPDGDRTLVDLFETVVPPADEPLDHLLAGLAEVTGWDLTQLTAVAGSLGLVEDDLRTEVQLLVVRDRLMVARRVGLAVDVLTSWAATEPDAARARAVVQAVKSRYEPERWLEVARELNDGLREAQRSALVDYLLPRMHDQGVDTPNQLYEFFLVDPGMQSCMLTSRVRLALSSVQLYVQRCLLNLELGIAPEDIDGDRWTENSIYRVWEANRKVFLYPENWVHPGLRLPQDKSPFCRLAETELLQNELTDENVEQVYLNYLRRLDEVARLDVRAMHWEEEPVSGPGTGVDRLHVVARTKSPPYRYFYRRFDNHRQWTPWETVDLDIGDAPHLVLLIHNRRLQVLWTSFTPKPSALQPSSDPAGETVPPWLQWDVQLGWSELRQGAWSPKQLSSVVRQPGGDQGVEVLPPISSFLWLVQHNADRLLVHLGQDSNLGADSYTRAVDRKTLFQRDGATAALALAKKGNPPGWPIKVPDGATVAGMGLEVTKHLWLRSLGLGDKKILGALPTAARLLRSNLVADISSLRYYPFFLADGLHSYLAYPVDATTDWTDHLVGPAVSDPGLLVELGDLFATDVPIGPPGDPVVFDLDAVGSPLPLQASLSQSAQGGSGADGLSHKKASGGPTFGETLQQDFLNPDTGITLARQYELRFATFWHPHVSELVRALNRDGLPGLLTLANQQRSLDGLAGPLSDGTLFTGTYAPTGKVALPRPRADVDFSPDGAYALYNWELFFHLPLLIADRLRQEGRYAEARRWTHYVFDPTTDEAGATPQRFWRFKPLHDNDEYARVQEMLELLAYTGNDHALLERKQEVANQIADWQDHPFEPHRIARLRLVAYQKNVVMRYIDLLLEWADSLFGRDTIESINEATQLYVLAANLLGRRPHNVPARSTVASKTYAQLQSEGLDLLSNTAVALENVLFPFAAPSQSGSDGEGSSILGLDQTLYFCAPNNEQLLRYWDQVEDRLFKIRHCLNIEGGARQLALFDPPIDPAALVRAAAAGADLDSVLGDLFAPLPPYRFAYLIGKAHELCAEVKSLGGQLLAAMQSRDAERLAQLRSVQEQALLAAVKAVKQQQIREAESAKTAMERSKAVVDARHTFYASIEKVSAKEKDQKERLADAQMWQELANLTEVGVAAAGAAPEVVVGTSGAWSSPVATVSLGRGNAVAIAQSASRLLSWQAGRETYSANLASINAGHERRWVDWKLQEQLAELESKQIQQQIDGADLRRQIAEMELANHELQMTHAAETDELLRRKFTNQELYDWLVSQVSALYHQAYKLAYDMAKRAERAYRFERGLDTSNFMTSGYWEGTRKGLLAGERLSLDLKRLETAYMEQNRRDYELSLRVPLSQWDPQALVQLKTSGTCEVELTEELYDANCPGHYFRRIKSLGLTVACVTGPYTNVNCTVTMLGNRTRISSGAAATYREQPDDPRFRYDFAADSRIATSHGNDDSGMRELNFRDERYLPFEGAGAICRLRIDMPPEVNAWDLETASDVVLTVRYDAREGGELLGAAALTSLKEAMGLPAGAENAHNPPLRRLLSARHELSVAWHRFQHPADEAAAQELSFDLTTEHYPYLLRGRTLEVSRLDLFVVPEDPGQDLVPSEGIAIVVALPDETTLDLLLTPAADGDPISLPHASSPDSFPAAAATGPWKVSVPSSLPASALSDLLVVLTYHVAP